MNDTIFALSSGAPPAAVAVVRISGPGAEAALASLAGRAPPPRRASVRTLRAGGETLDRALVLRFPAPASATGEDMVELHLHGGRSVVAGLLAALGKLTGLRPAEPGEFTRRAFENGRIDLAEAEGLADLLAAETQSQRRAALALAGGALSRQVALWQEHILSAAAAIEAVLDFSDEADVAEEADVAWRARVAALATELRGVTARPSADRLRDGVKVVIAGPPNAGKSSVLNHLCSRDAAITSEIEGTTRDLVEAPTALGGTPFLLVDTAGLRASVDPVESIGIDRARRSLEAADLILWLGDPAEAPADRGRTILVHNKSDLRPPKADCDASISALTGEGMEALVALLVRRAADLLPREGELAINARHRAALADCAEALEAAAEEADPLIAAEHLRQSRAALDRITGRAGVEEMLGALFGRFCIGK